MRHTRVHAVSHQIPHIFANPEDVAEQLLVTEALRSVSKRKQRAHAEALRRTISYYLKSVNANIVLARDLNVGFHDWIDFAPFYRKKLLSIGERHEPLEEERSQLENLFTLSFPQLRIETSGELIEILNDRRLTSLRDLVSRATRGEISFDHDFASSVLLDVFESRTKLARKKSISGYLTLPLGMIPVFGTPIQKAVDEAIGLQLQKQTDEKHRWFFMLTDAKRNSRKNHL